MEQAVGSGAGDVDRARDPVRAAAGYELGHGCGSLDGDEGRDLAKQPARDQNAASAIALGERRRQRQPKLMSLIVVVIDGRELMGEQARRLFEAQAGRAAQSCEKHVTQPDSMAPAGTVRTCGGNAPTASNRAKQDMWPKGS